ncbi:MAG: carbohydrate-binding family 9-like protein [Opitutales bacterium]|jgi:hypothetical protein|nr:carbohydrate-binding family 9-like protein [Opitutales bacterium]MBT5170043.1 carbohydrate-binding family 9-like protein [Opitutales bacterium]MBT5814799.1 carbohydrate-binding family 9-like protein [Opitutales bacterium]MBT6768744.1 carbohydrate-binding family 9-like protein [Opitutales bacterium]MBT7867316.1 carbohydrate-binding family 9-like protein [Opitutales bacterium]
MSVKIRLVLLLLVAVTYVWIFVTDEMDPLGRELKEYRIQYTELPITIDGRLDELAWESAVDVDAFEFPWWEAGRKEQTRTRLLWDDEYLYVSFVCEDAYISGEHTERDSPVYEDDCVEVFTSPNPAELNKYFNVEMNVLGASLEHIHPEGPGTKATWDPLVKIATTIDGTLNDDTDIDRSWTLEIAIPFSSFAEVAVHTPPLSGDEWRMNLNRLGGKVNRQASQWSPGDPDDFSFHAPQYFGVVRFAK